MNKSFIKVPRTKKESGTGKGGFWKLASDCRKGHSMEMDSPQAKRHRHSKRSTEIPSKSSHENEKVETWIDPILPCSVPTKTQSPLHCHTTILDRSYIRMPSSFLSPTSSPDTLTVSPFNHQSINDFSAILTPSPSTSPSSVISKPNHLPNTKLDETDMLLLDPSTFDWDAYLYETPTDIDLSSKSEQDLFNEFNAALTDLTSSAETAAAVGAGADPNTFDAFDYSSKPSTFHCLFEDDEQETNSSEFSSSNPSTDLTVKGCGIKRPTWWSSNESIPTSTKLPSLETAFDLKLSKQ